MKYARHAKILEIISEYEIKTQEKLLVELAKRGLSVTQATISRDIRELRLIKVLSKDGKYKYATLKNYNSNLNDRLIRLFKDSILAIDHARNIIVLKTLPGTAQAAASAIDATIFEGIVGTLAGDDTIFVLVRDEDMIGKVKSNFDKLIE
ncbi:MAG: arginine repressor [Alkaliphilus sp.]